MLSYNFTPRWGEGGEELIETVIRIKLIEGGWG